MTTTRELLLTERARAQDRAAALGLELTGISEAASQPGTDDEHDPEGATLAFERQHTAALLARSLERIAEIEAAIGRLEGGTYGLCLRCGQPIGEGRLTARPAAATCLRCARLPSTAQPPRDSRWRAAHSGGRAALLLGTLVQGGTRGGIRALRATGRDCGRYDHRPGGRQSL
jgi:RNA polymerase-binding transcription factor DksA